MENDTNSIDFKLPKLSNSDEIHTMLESISDFMELADHKDDAYYVLFVRGNIVSVHSSKLSANVKLESLIEQWFKEGIDPFKSTIISIEKNVYWLENIQNENLDESNLSDYNSFGSVVKRFADLLITEGYVTIEEKLHYM